MDIDKNTRQRALSSAQSEQSNPTATPLSIAASNLTLSLTDQNQNHTS